MEDIPQEHEKYLTVPFKQGEQIQRHIESEVMKAEQTLAADQDDTEQGQKKSGRRGAVKFNSDDLQGFSDAMARVEKAVKVSEGICAALSTKWVKMKLKDRHAVDSSDTKKLSKLKNKLAMTVKKQSKEEFHSLSSPEARLQKLADPKTMGKAAERQREYSAGYDRRKAAREEDPQAEQEHAYKPLFDAYKLQNGGKSNWQGVREAFTPGSISGVAGTIIGTTHCCYIMSITCPKLIKKDGTVPGHALALYCSGGNSMKSKEPGNVYFFDPNHGEYKVPKNEFSNFLQSFLQSNYGTKDTGITKLQKWSI